MGKLGNTFGSNDFSVGHSRKVWREVNDRFPGGATIDNLSEWTKAGLIPAGTPVKFDPSAKTATAYTDTKVKGAENISTLGINGYTLTDVPLASSDKVATVTVVRAGSLWKFMYAEDVLAKLSGAVAGIVFDE